MNDEEKQDAFAVEGKWGVDDETRLVYITCYWPTKGKKAAEDGMLVSVTLPRSVSDGLIKLREMAKAQDHPKGSKAPFDFICYNAAKLVAAIGGLLLRYAAEMLKQPSLGDLQHPIMMGGIWGIDEQLKRHAKSFRSAQLLKKRQQDCDRRLEKLFGSTPEENQGE